MKKIIYRIGMIGLFLAGLVLIYHALDYLLSNDTTSLSRITFHDYYEDKDPDILFLGTSHTVHSINAVKLTEDTGKSVYNLSTHAQDFVGAYYIIKEALENYDIETIFYEVSISRFDASENKTVRSYIITDYMKSQIVRAQMLLHSFDSDQYISSFFRLRRNVDPLALPTLSSIRKLAARKSTPEYRSYTNKAEIYLGRGQWDTSARPFTQTMAVNLDSSFIDHMDTDDIQEEEWNYFLKIMDICKEAGVELKLLISPYSEFYLMCFDNYEKITQLVYEAAQERGVDLIDLTLVKPEYCDIVTTDFYRLDHVSVDASSKIADFLELYMEDPEGDYFCASVEERFPHHDQVVAALFRRYYVTKKREYRNKDKAKGTIDHIRLEVSALAYTDIPARARAWVVTEDEQTGGWIETEELTGESVDQYTTQFLLTDTKLKTHYRLQLLDPDTEEVLFETVTRFNMS